MFKIQVELKNYSRRADKSVSLRVDSLYEVRSEDIAEIDSHIGDYGILILTDTAVGDEVDFDVNKVLEDLQPDSDLVKKKTPSKRFRDILWKLQEQRLGRAPTEEEFAKYYKSEYEKICNHYLNKFDDVGNI